MEATNCKSSFGLKLLTRAEKSEILEQVRTFNSNGYTVEIKAGSSLYIIEVRKNDLLIDCLRERVTLNRSVIQQDEIKQFARSNNIDDTVLLKTLTEIVKIFTDPVEPKKKKGYGRTFKKV